MSSKSHPEKIKNPFSRALTSVYIVSIIGIIFYAYLDFAGYLPSHWLKPLPGQWNDNVIYIMILVGSILATGAGVIWTNRFEKQDKPRQVWIYFTIGWGCWVLGELLGFIYRYIYAFSPPSLTLEDICWTAGYAFFALALFLQYRIIYAPDKKSAVSLLLIAILIILLITTLLSILAMKSGLGEDGNWLGLFTSILYPICDLAEGVAAVWLAFLFGKGLWVRPWWGLIAFAFADGIYTWYWIFTPSYLSASADALISTVADTLYFGAYIIVALGCYSNFLLLSAKSSLSSINKPEHPGNIL